MKILILLNPVSGKHTALKAEPALKKRLEATDHQWTIIHTEYPGHATLLAKQLADDYDVVLAAGGDGMASETLRGLQGKKCAFGLIPCGTGNDFIKTAGTPKDPLEALEFVLTQEPTAIDACFVNGVPFLNACGTGFDVSVLDNTVGFKKYFRGLLPYALGLFRAIFTYEPTQLRLEIDGKAEDRSLLICSVDQGRIFGGGIPICPVADLKDGYLDLVLVQHVPKHRICGYLPALMMGKILEYPITEHRLCRHIILEKKGMRLNIDGEIQPMDRAEFTIVPKGLMIYCAG